MRRVPLALALASLAAMAAASQSERAPALAIVDPAVGRYISGLQTLRVRFDPEGLAIVRLTFAADGDPVCTRQAPPWECEWDAGQDVVAHNIRAVAVLADGSRLVDSVRTEAAGFAPTVTVDVVQVPATVTDGGGRLVKGLAPKDFRIYENELRQEISHFIGADAARELVVAVDMSGSMGPAMTTCREAVKRFFATHPAGGPRDAARVQRRGLHRCAARGAAGGAAAGGGPTARMGQHGLPRRDPQGARSARRATVAAGRSCSSPTARTW